MSTHSHREYVEGCFRCDLSRDEAHASEDTALRCAAEVWPGVPVRTIRHEEDR